MRIFRIKFISITIFRNLLQALILFRCCKTSVLQMSAQSMKVHLVTNRIRKAKFYINNLRIVAELKQFSFFIKLIT